MAHIHLIVHVMHELVPKSALIVLMGRHVNKAHIRNQTWKHMLLSPLTTITRQYANPRKGYNWWYIHNASQIYTWKTRYLQVVDSTVSAITSTSGQKERTPLWEKSECLRTKCRFRTTPSPYILPKEYLKIKSSIWTPTSLNT